MKYLTYLLLLWTVPGLAQQESPGAHHQTLRTLNQEMITHIQALEHPLNNERKKFEREAAREHLRGMRHCMEQQRHHIKELRAQGDPYGMTPHELRQMSTYHSQNIKHHRKLAQEINRKSLRPSRINAHRQKIHRNAQKMGKILGLD